MRCPIILGVEGESRDLLTDAGVGIAITPESAEELAAAVTSLADDPNLGDAYGAQGSAYVRNHFDRVKLAERYLELLEEVIVEHARPSLRQARAYDSAHMTDGQ